MPSIKGYSPKAEFRGYGFQFDASSIVVEKVPCLNTLKVSDLTFDVLLGLLNSKPYQQGSVTWNSPKAYVLPSPSKSSDNASPTKAEKPIEPSPHCI